MAEHRESGCTSPQGIDLRIRQEAENFDISGGRRSTPHFYKSREMCPATGKDQFRAWDLRNHVRPNIDENILTFAEEIVRSSKKKQGRRSALRRRSHCLVLLGAKPTDFRLRESADDLLGPG